MIWREIIFNTFFFKAEHLTFIVVVIKPAVSMYYVQLLIGLNFDAMPLM